MVVDESNVQMSSLREQLDAAQQRLDMAEADVTVLQATETNLQQQLRSTQVGYYLTEVLHRSGHNVASVTDVFQIMICMTFWCMLLKSMPACSITAAFAYEVSRHTNKQVHTDSTSCY